VSEPNAALPAWIAKRDGRLEPFDADRIVQALFDASESLGSPDAFLARELTDAVLHFFRPDPPDAIPTTDQVVEQVVKVVRELGQPALAQAFAARREHGRAGGRAAPGPTIAGPG
jgi:ribonucleoside-triphosphate reductase